MLILIPRREKKGDEEVFSRKMVGSRQREAIVLNLGRGKQEAEMFVLLTNLALRPSVCDRPRGVSRRSSALMANHN